MPVTDTMRLCSKVFLFRFILVSLASLPALGQTTPAATAQAPASQAPPQPSTATATTPDPAAQNQRPVLRPETQQPLNVDRDPIPSPDSVDNETVSPDHPGNNPAHAEDIEKSGSGRFTVRRNVDEVVLNATVVDDNHRLVNDLTKEDFKIAEDGVPQTIASFQHQDIPVSMGILVDNSGSMRDKRAAVNSAAVDLVKASNPQDEAFIVNFSDEAFIDQDFTSDLNKLREGLSHIDSKGGTALYDAVVASADQLARGAKRSKQVLLIITDGEDNASSLTLEQTIRRVQQLQGPVVYTIGLLFGDGTGGRESRRAQRALRLLSDETGGLAFFPKSLAEIDSIAAEVAKDIRTQYTIGYHSTKPVNQGGYRTIKVDARASGHGKMVVRTKSGYYPKVAADTPAPTAATPGNK